MFARFRGPAPNPNLNAAKSKLSQNISNYARAVNAHKRAVASPNNKTPEQISSLNKAARNKRALAMDSLNAYLNKVIQANVNKFQTAQSEKAAATAAANATLASRVLNAVKKAGVASPNQPTQANVNKLRTVINKVSRGGLGSRMIGTTRITNNMVQPLKNTLATMVSKLGAAEQAGAEAQALAEVRKRYTNQMNVQMGTGASANAILNGILAVRRNTNANRNLMTLVGNNKYSQYFRNANGKLKAGATANSQAKAKQIANFVWGASTSYIGLHGGGIFPSKGRNSANNIMRKLNSKIPANQRAGLTFAALNAALSNRPNANRNANRKKLAQEVLRMVAPQ